MNIRILLTEPQWTALTELLGAEVETSDEPVNFTYQEILDRIDKERHLQERVKARSEARRSHNARSNRE